ncbi:MAG: fructosamine kinase family protein [Spirochaetales bacterium]|nr:fructosamine kinase family protein [Spirochaetales bacterium]
MIKNASSLSEVVQELFGVDVLHQHHVAGGDINETLVLELQNRKKVFLKKNRHSPEGMFLAEALGLQKLLDAHKKSQGASPPSPRPLAVGKDGIFDFLLMEHIDGGPAPSGEEFGHSLAQLHSWARRSTCGFDENNWIGLTPQINDEEDSWPHFFYEKRLLPQWRWVLNQGFSNSRAQKGMNYLEAHIDDVLPACDSGGASLLHGDLWGGNWISGNSGTAWLVDPACYYGHREADMAMTELFGGFPPGFAQGYQNAWPLEQGFRERKNLYNLYHLLNHVNLFGASYWGAAVQTLGKYGS